MTVSAGIAVMPPLPRESPPSVQVVAGVFDLLADFLEKCQLSSAASAIRLQLGKEEPPALDGAFVQHLSTLANGIRLVVGHLDGSGEEPCRQDSKYSLALDQIIDAMVGKLADAGHSDFEVNSKAGADGLLGNEALKHLAFLDEEHAGWQVVGDGADLVGVSSSCLQQCWEEIQTESIATADAVLEAASQDINVLAASAAKAEGTQPISPWEKMAVSSSSHYVPRRASAFGGLPESPPSALDDHDDYHDDDDPGYRIREIYEAELLAELSAKMASGRVPGGPAAVGSSATPRGEDGGVVDELASCVSTPHGATPTTDRGTMVAAESGKSQVVSWPAVSVDEDDSFGSDSGAKAFSSSPSFGGMPGARGDGVQQASDESLEKQRSRHRRNVKYATSGDPFYPVELDGVVYDSFGLRVVFERDKTGFEDSKEFPIRMNSVVAARYQILEHLGSAAFSRAVQCLDLETNKMVCMKIIKNDKDFFDQSLDEIKLLKYININGDVDKNRVLRLYDHLYHKEHLIIVTELLRDNLYEFSKINRECGDEPYFTLGRLQRIAHQVLTALEYIHSLRLIHCDLKPENILIRSYTRCEVKVIDFGSSCFVDDHLSSYVQSRSYRAPEVMLGLPYDQKIDIWSLACILAELWTGYVLFQNDSVQSLLARILGIVGDFPYHLMTRGRYVPQYFTQDGQLYQEVDSPACPERGRRLHLLVPKKTSLQQRMRTDCKEFLDFLSHLLQLDPTRRPTASEALQHPWLTQCKYGDGL